MLHSILYLAYGDIGYINECRFSILKYLSVYNLKPPSDTAIIVYTDTPALFENFIPFFRQFTIIEISKEQLNAWYGKWKYIHRAKPEVIKDYASKNEGTILFLDTDTYITKPIDALWQNIAGNTVYMHNFEGVINKKVNPEFKKWDDFLSTAQIAYGDKQFVYTPDFGIWNSGVLGLNSASAPIINDVLLLIDSIHQKFPKHITEQVACSYCFREYKKESAAGYIVHYWNLKEFRTLLNTFFKKNDEESIPNLVKLVHHMDAQKILEDKMRYKKLPFYQKYLDVLLGKGWSIKSYLKKL